MGRRIFLALARTGSDPRWLILTVGSNRYGHKLFPRTHPHKSWGGKLMINIYSRRGGRPVGVGCSIVEVEERREGRLVRGGLGADGVRVDGASTHCLFWSVH
jgi:hypothetical protein